MFQTAIINIHSKLSSLSQHKNFCCSQIYSLDRAQWEQSISRPLHVVAAALAWSPGLAGSLEPRVWNYPKVHSVTCLVVILAVGWNLSWGCYLETCLDCSQHILGSIQVIKAECKVIFKTLEVTLGHFCCSVSLGSHKGLPDFKEKGLRTHQAMRSV